MRTKSIVFSVFLAFLTIVVLLLAQETTDPAEEVNTPPAPAVEKPPETQPLTRQNWGASVGLPPAQPPEGYQPGLTISSANLEQFAAIVPHPVATLVRNHGLKLRTREYAPYSPSDGFIAATQAARGKAGLIEIGDDWNTKGIAGYEGGLPFPQPQNGREVAWNYLFSYGGDDGANEFSVYWIDAKKGVERSEQWQSSRIRTRFRTDIEPLPTVESLADNDVFAASITTALTPLDKKGYSSLYFGYESMREPDGWIYIPSQRRTVKFSFGLTGESWNNTDLLYEDVRGYTGRPEWMHWKILEKGSALLPFHSGAPIGDKSAEKIYDFKKAPYWNPDLLFELRSVYILEATPKTPDYPYSRMLFWVDAESFYILAKTAYDRKGNLWKVLINAINESEDPASLPPQVGASLVVDLQSQHATAFAWKEVRANFGADPDNFRLSTLRKMGR